ncbi:MAG: transcriptional repressor [candidate division Zixibacteria bacterium]|nr:transcriptional repressor [candidate division Zixibacteria bacterium]
MMLQRNTVQRQVILEELRKLTSHPTAQEMYRLVQKRLPDISLGTVYRNLDLLSRAGLIVKLRLASREVRFDGDIEQHHHVRCKNCGRVGDIMSTNGRAVDEILPEIEGWEIVGKRTEFVGICPDCSISGSSQK